MASNKTRVNVLLCIDVSIIPWRRADLGMRMAASLQEANTKLQHMVLHDALTKLPQSLFDVRTKLTRRCPGAAVAPAPDGSSPIKLDASLCDLSQTPNPSINER